MSTVTATKKLMTVEEFEALPDDGAERWLIRGVLYEKRDTEMTRRNRFHSTTEANVTWLLRNWLAAHPQQGGVIACGEVGFLLRRNPDSIAAADVAYIGPATAAANPTDTTLFDGPPVLAVEIESPNDTTQEINDKVRAYLDAGTLQVWIINPYARTMVVHRPNTPSTALDVRDTLTGDPELPGFSAAVADFFH